MADPTDTAVLPAEHPTSREGNGTGPMMRPTVQVRPLGRDQAPALFAMDQWAFAFDDEDLDTEPVTATLEWDRTYGGHLGDDLAGIYSVFSLDLPIPGGSLPCAGLTWVGVHPQFRRRGVLSGMMAHHLRTTYERGEVITALHASETTIYGRFGYGISCRHLRLTLPRGADLNDVPGWQSVRLRIERADVDRHADVIGDCYEAARVDRPGMASRNTEGHRRYMLDDPPKWREGAESLRVMIAEDDGDGIARGYALFRRKEHWEGALPKGTVQVKEVVARDPATARALWGCLLDLDLMTTVETDERPVDDPLLHLLKDPRSVLPTLVDGLWVRLVDLAPALTARQYVADFDVVLEVADAHCPWNAGRWRLSGGPDGSACVRTDADPDVSLDVRELGSVYLGSLSLSALAASGRIQVMNAAALHAASVAFAWPVAGYCGWGF